MPPDPLEAGAQITIDHNYRLETVHVSNRIPAHTLLALDSPIAQQFEEKNLMVKNDDCRAQEVID